MSTDADLPLRSYHFIMEEVKERIAAIDSVTTGAVRFPDKIAVEFCFLQLRMICELVALGCLVAHGDIAETQSAKYQKEYSADRILTKLEGLHPDFFPRPLGSPIQKPGGYHFPEHVGDAFTKAEFVALVGRCGDHLHRGSAKTLLNRSGRRSPTLIELATTTQRLASLLSIHATTMRHNRAAIVCLLRAAPHGAVQVLSLEAI